MEFQFLKDDELFNIDYSDKQMICRFFRRNEGFAAAMEKKVSEICEGSEGTFKLYSDNAWEQLERRKRRSLFTSYTKIEKVADKYADETDILVFPPDKMMEYIQDGETYDIIYFEEQNKISWDMSGAGRVGSYLSNAASCIKRVEKKASLGGGLSVYFIALIIFYILCCGSDFPLLSGVIPNIIPELMNGEYKFIARVIVAIIMFGTSALFMTFGFQNNESILKWVANGFFQLILVAAGFLCAATLIMSMEIENLALLFWPFAAYYALIEVCFILMCLKDNMQIMKDRPKAKQEFCQLVERNQVHFHRYIRLHVLWWEDLYGKKPLLNSIVSMQNSFEKLMKYYKEYSK